MKAPSNGEVTLQRLRPLPFDDRGEEESRCQSGTLLTLAAVAAILLLCTFIDCLHEHPPVHAFGGLVHSSS